MEKQADKLVKIGLLGGMSHVSTVHYYQTINGLVNAAQGKAHTAEYLIRSVNFQRITDFVQSEDWAGAGQYLGEAARSLEAGGADFVLLCTNTMHKVRQSILDNLTIPFIDIMEATARVCHQIGEAAQGKQERYKIGMLGTLPVMTDPFYAEAYQAYGVELIAPDPAQCKVVDDIIWQELCLDQVLDSSREKYLEIIVQLKEAGAQGVILGCTEIQMLIDASDNPALPLIDTMGTHCQAAADHYLSLISPS